MADGAPRLAKAAIANPGPNPRSGRSIGGGCQGKARVVQYAHAVPPSRNASGKVVLEQRAYFSAWRIVFDVPSVMAANVVRPCGPGVGGPAPDTSPFGA